MDFFGVAPMLTTPAGGCLTAANWQDAKVSLAACHLAPWLMKPGIEVLSLLNGLASYMGWSLPWVLNASTLSMRSEDLFEVRSHFDGKKNTYSTVEILTLIKTLAPNGVILPKAIWHLYEALPEEMLCFIHSSALSEAGKLNRSYGAYYSHVDRSSTLAALCLHQMTHPDVPCYVSGDIGQSLIRECFENGAQIVETDRPAADGYQGIAYGEEGAMAIHEVHFALQFTPLDANCDCKTCSQKLTRAYLHHLWHHTPLLCQRFIIQHNVHLCAQTIC
ncbi:MAG: hypothetical protein NTW94_07435 [Legionellales bacterium]|nr:hypothetical protein [Legionellales bacterium]